MDLAAAMALAATLWLSLPHGDSVWDLLETVAAFAFTEPMNTGGTMTGVPLYLGSEASSWTQASFRLGIADVTDGATGGRPLIYPDLSLLGNVHVRTSAANLVSGAPGPVLTLTPMAGGSAWIRDVSFAGSPSAFQAKGSSTLPPIARLHALARVQGSVGGPLTPRIGMFAAGAGTWSSHNERRESFRLPGDVLSAMAHPTFALSSERRAEVTAWLQQARTPLAGRALLRDRHAAATQSYRGLTAAWAGGVNRAFEVNASLASTAITPQRSVDAAQHGTVERLVDDPLEHLVNESGGTHHRRSIAATLTTGSRVRMNGGISFSGIGMESSPFGTGLIGETIDGQPSHAWEYGMAGTSRRSATTFAMYAQAESHLVGPVRIDGGLRLENVRASADGAAQGISWTSIEPRLSLHYAQGPWRGALTARRYHPRLALNVLANGDPAAANGRSYLWTDRNGDMLAQADERGALVSLVGPGSPTPGFSTIDPSLKRPFVDELQAAIDVRIKPSVSLRFSGVSRRGGDLLARYNVGVPFDAYTVHQIFDPGLNLGGDEDDQMLSIYSRPPATFGRDRYLLTNIPSVNSTYGGLYIATLFERSPRWHVLVAATALHSYAPAAFRGYAPSENDEMLVGDSYSDPNSNTYVEGRTVFDRGYGLKVAAAYKAPRGLTIAAVGRYADGQNFARIVVVPDLPQGTETVRAYANGKSKFTFTTTLDLRVQKTMTWQGHNIVFGVESYNTTNLRNEVEENTVTGPMWRVSTFSQPPRVIRITFGTSF